MEYFPAGLTRGTQNQACLKWGKLHANENVFQSRQNHPGCIPVIPSAFLGVYEGQHLPPFPAAFSSELKLTHRIHCEMGIAQYTFGRTGDTMVEPPSDIAGLFPPRSSS